MAAWTVPDFPKQKWRFVPRSGTVKSPCMRPTLTGEELIFRYRMRTLGLSLGATALAASLSVSLAVPSLANAQRNGHRSLRRSAVPSAASSATHPCSSDCGSYSLAVVSALLPVETPGSTSDVATLVIENRGTASAPASLISVAPQNHLAAARRSTIPALAPGERATVRLPVETGPDGTRCISITISPAPANDPATAQFLASAIPGLSNGLGAPPPVLSPFPEIPYWPDLPDVAILRDDRNFADLGEFLPFDAYAAI